jgi:hypothetical protein
MYMHTLQKLFAFIFVLLASVSMVSAQELTQNTEQEQTTQALCFEMLKNDLTETGTFFTPLQELEGMTYQDLEAGFSRTYKSLSSFGNLEVGAPIIEHRIYSFGEQTGYIHPPLSPFPSSLNSEQWDTPARQYIVVEEYINTPTGEQYFMDCGFIEIASENLMDVTREVYSHDGVGTTLKKTAPDNSHKSWYSDFPSFNYQAEPFVEWRRLFVYPKATENEYFSKYAVADAYPANEVESYDVLEFNLQSFVSLQEYGENSLDNNQIFAIGEDGELEEVVVPEALQPYLFAGKDRTFSKNSYYEAIEARFPEFYEKLAFRGALQYDTYKEYLVVEEGTLDERVDNMLWGLYEFKTIKSYYADKVKNETDGVTITNPVLDPVLADILQANEVIEEVNSKIDSEKNEKESYENEKTMFASKTVVYITMLILVLLIGGVVAYLVYRERKPQAEQSNTTQESEEENQATTTSNDNNETN